jgi:hypothetical protein
MKCHYAARIWFGSKLGIKFDNSQISFIDWLTHSINTLKEEDISYVAAITYGIWFARNQQAFDLNCMDNIDVINKASRCLQEFQLALANNHSSIPNQHQASTNPRFNRHHSTNNKWTRPENGVIKVNSDANLSIAGSWGLGAVYRDTEGAILAAATWSVPGSNDPTLAEAYALYKAILLAIDCGFFEVICESDNASVIQLLNDVSKNPRLYIGNLIQGILCNRGRFRGISFRSIGREANKVAHCLAALAHQEPNRVWLEEAPPCITPLLIRDLIN